jgi:hypothetical protein
MTRRLVTWQHSGLLTQGTSVRRLLVMIRQKTADLTRRTWIYGSQSLARINGSLGSCCEPFNLRDPPPMNGSILQN